MNHFLFQEIKQKAAAQPGRTAEEPGLYNNPLEVEIYDTHSRKRFVAWIERMFVRDILKHLGHVSHLQVLDVGTGPGWIPIMLAKARPTWTITALDASQLMLENARKHAEAQQVKINWVLAKAEKIPLPAAGFDLVISHFAFHEFPGPSAVVNEMERLLKPGGSLVIQDLRRPYRWEMLPLVVLVTIASGSLKMGRQYRDSLRASYRAHELKKILAVSQLVSTVEVRMRYAGGILRAWGTKPRQLKS